MQVHYSPSTNSHPLQPWAAGDVVFCADTPEPRSTSSARKIPLHRNKHSTTSTSSTIDNSPDEPRAPHRTSGYHLTSPRRGRRIVAQRASAGTTANQNRALEEGDGISLQIRLTMPERPCAGWAATPSGSDAFFFHPGVSLRRSLSRPPSLTPRLMAGAPAGVVGSSIFDSGSTL